MSRTLRYCGRASLPQAHRRECSVLLTVHAHTLDRWWVCGLLLRFVSRAVFMPVYCFLWRIGRARAAAAEHNMIHGCGPTFSLNPFVASRNWPNYKNDGSTASAHQVCYHLYPSIHKYASSGMGGSEVQIPHMTSLTSCTIFQFLLRCCSNDA